MATKKPANAAHAKVRAKPFVPVPNWFDLKNYEFLKDLDAGGWSLILHKLLYLDSLTEAEIDVIYSSTGDTEAPLGERLETLLNDIDWFKDSTDFLGRGSLYRIDSEKFEFGGIAALKCRTVASMAAALTKVQFGREMIEKFSAMKREATKAGSKDKNAISDQVLDEPFFLALGRTSDNNKLPVSRAIAVDMRLPDDLLIESFKLWLAAMRGFEFHSAPKKSFDSMDFAKWIDFQYVPLLLLMKWSELSAVRISKPKLIATLYPRHSSITPDNMKNTHCPNVRKWACRATYNALKAQSEKSNP